MDKLEPPKQIGENYLDSVWGRFKDTPSKETLRDIINESIKGAYEIGMAYGRINTNGALIAREALEGK